MNNAIVLFILIFIITIGIASYYHFRTFDTVHSKCIKTEHYVNTYYGFEPVYDCKGIKIK
jgi:hypothetical protein